MFMRRTIICLITALFIAGCGFHLRGRVPLSATLSVIAVETGDTRLRTRVVEGLETSGASVVTDSTQAKAVLKIHDVQYERKVRSIDSRGKANGYTLIYTVRYTVTRQDGSEVRKAVPIRLERDFNFDSAQVLQKEREETALRRDMEKDMAQRILRQLSTIAGRGVTRPVVAQQHLPTVVLSG